MKEFASIYISNLFACNNHEWWEVDISCKAKTCLSRLTCIIANLFFLRPIDMSKKWGTNFGDVWTSSNFVYWEWPNVGPVLGDVGIS